MSGKKSTANRRREQESYRADIRSQHVVDAIREVLGLEPLYTLSEFKRRTTEERFFVSYGDFGG